MMPGAQPPRGPSCQALLAEVQALRQRVAALEQDKLGRWWWAILAPSNAPSMAWLAAP
jgi:hypothetical protein